MTSQEFRDALDALGFSQTAAGPCLGVDARTIRRWASGESAIPMTAQILLAKYLSEIPKPEPGEKTVSVRRSAIWGVLSLGEGLYAPEVFKKGCVDLLAQCIPLLLDSSPGHALWASQTLNLSERFMKSSTGNVLAFTRAAMETMCRQAPDKLEAFLVMLDDCFPPQKT